LIQVEAEVEVEMQQSKKMRGMGREPRKSREKGHYLRVLELKESILIRTSVIEASRRL